MDTNARPLLSLVCPGCGAAFPSAMQMDPRTFEGIRLSNLLECCPNCSRVSRFNKPDYLFRSPAELKVCAAERAGQAGKRKGLLPVVRAPGA